MTKIKTLYIIIFSLTLLCTGSIYAETASSEAVQQQMDESIANTEVAPESQASVYNQPEQKSETDIGANIESGIAGAVGCSAGQILGNIVSGLVSSAVTKVMGKVAEEVTDLTNVPVAEKGQVLLNSKTQTSAEVGTPVGLFGISGLALPSWNSIAYCVVNAMITYVANSTIAWVQGGFQGNPSFVNNPQEFFKDLANIEAGAFLQELAYGATGLNICEPFRAQIVLSIARDYISGQQGYGGNNGYSRGGFGGGAGGNVGYGGCTLDDVKGNLNSFLHGNFQKGGWDSWFKISQVDSNNPYTTYFSLQARLNGSIEKKQTLAQTELSWGKGFLSFRKCDEKTPKEEQSNCPITSPGIVIQGQLEKTLGLPKDRLVLAEKFDQVIAAVVNELVTVALDKVLETKSE